MHLLKREVGKNGGHKALSNEEDYNEGGHSCESLALADFDKAAEGIADPKASVRPSGDVVLHSRNAMVGYGNSFGSKLTNRSHRIQ